MPAMPPSLVSLLQQAQAHYAAGHLAEAVHAYRQALQEQPQNPEILFWLGLLHNQLGQLDDSVAYYQQVLQLEPNSVEAHSNLGTVLLTQRRLAESIAHQRQALALRPNDPNVHYNVAIALYEDGQIEAAIEQYQRVVDLQPDHANAHHNLGLALFRQGDRVGAIGHHRRAIALVPHHASAHNSLGVALLGQNQVEDALQCFQTAIDLKPDYASAHDNLGTALQRQGKLVDAIAAYQTAIALKPDAANAYSNLGTALKEQGNFPDAIAAFETAIRLQPDHADAYNNYGGTFVELGQYDAAIDCYEQAIRHKPDYADAHLNLGIMLLMQGHYQRGFVEYHWRWKTTQCPDLRYPQALWDGSPLQGRVILLTAEQGFGDTIQFARYAPLVAASGGVVVMACQKPLERLLGTLEGLDHCVDRDQTDVQTHVHCPLLDLPLLLGTTIATIPAQVPYLHPPEQHWELPAVPHTRLKVGIVWASNPANSTSSKRSCDLDAFLPLLEIPAVAFYSLQKDVSEADATRLAELSIQNLAPYLEDFAETAAAIVQLDLVITVDTAVAHLAGALAHPVWTLLPFSADWRWLTDREDTPWYPTMRLFRQSQPGDWVGVFQAVQVALQAIVRQPNALTPFKLDSGAVSLPAPVATVLSPKPCQHGSLIYYAGDRGVGDALEMSGEWRSGEINLLQHLVQPRDWVAEVGAGIGAQTVYWAKAVGRSGRVLAIEPQRLLFQTLCTNLVLNRHQNVYAYPVALGAAPGFQPLVTPTYCWPLPSQPPQTEQVQVVTLDSFGLSQCRLLKLNLSRAQELLSGATQTLQRCQPIVYWSVPTKDAGPFSLLQELGYELYRHPLPDGQVNLLALPSSYGIAVNGLKRWCI